MLVATALALAAACAESRAPAPDANKPAAAPRAVRVRPSAVAGSWYPGDPKAVAREIDRLIGVSAVAPALSGKPIALVVPHAGWSYSGAAAAAAFRNLHPGDFARVVVIGPSHHHAFAGFSIADVGAYRTPLGDAPVCAEAAGLRDGQIVKDEPLADQHEHSIEIEIPLLQQTLRTFCLIPILAGQTTPAMEQALADKLAKLDDKKTLFVVSSDFVHYGPRFDYTPFGPSAILSHDKIVDLQKKAIGWLEKKDAAGFRGLLASTGATICGRDGISVLLELLPRIAPKAKGVLLAHYASSEMPDAKDDNGVWYVAFAYVEGGAPDGRPPMGVPSER
jgi:MEMO1 family protein